LLSEDDEIGDGTLDTFADPLATRVGGLPGVVLDERFRIGEIPAIAPGEDPLACRVGHTVTDAGGDENEQV